MRSNLLQFDILQGYMGSRFLRLGETIPNGLVTMDTAPDVRCLGIVGV